MVEKKQSTSKNFLLVGRHSLKKGQIKNALSNFREALDCDSEKVANYLELGRLLICIDEKEEGLAILNSAVEKFPDHPQANIRLGAALSKCEKNTEARTRYEKAVFCSHDVPLWVHYEARSQVYSMISMDEYRLAYFPIPKCGSTTIKNVLYKTTNGVDHGNPHAAFNYSEELTQKSELEPYRDFFKAVIVRDPIKRFISYFYKNIISNKSLENIYGKYQRVFNLNCIPNINFFIEHLEDYVYVFNDVRHHTLPQKAYLGNDLDNFNMVYKLEDINDFVDKLSEITKSKISMTQRMKSNRKVEELLAEISPKSMQKLLKVYKEDYELLSKYYPTSEITKEYQQMCLAVC